MKKTNTIACGIAFALPVLYFGGQAFLNGKYLFIILATAGLLFWTSQIKKVYVNEEAMTEEAQGIWVEKEADICVALTALLWVSYIGVYDIKQIPENLSEYKVFIWIPMWLIVCRLLDGIKNSLVTIHLKAVVGLALAFFSYYILEDNAPVLLIQGYMSILGMVYLVSVKRYLRRGVEERQGLKFTSLYRGAAVILFSYTMFATYYWYCLSMLYYRPLSIVRVHWLVLAAMTIVAVVMMINIKNLPERCMAGNIFLILIYYFAVRRGYATEFSIVGILSACLLAGWLAELLYQQRIIKGVEGIPLFYIFYLPVAYLLTESAVKGKHLIFFLIAVAVLLIKEVVDRAEVTKKTSILKILLIIPYLILIFEYGSKENRNMLLLAGFTVFILIIFVLLTVQQENGSRKVRSKKTAAWIIFIGCWILIPLLAAVKCIREDRKYPEYFFKADTEELSIGTEIALNLNGFNENAVVCLDWGEGQMEKLQGNTELATTIKSGHLKLTVREKGGEEYTYHKFFLLWNLKEQDNG